MSNTPIAPTADRASTWNSLYRLGAAAALGTLLVGLVEIGITFLPGGNTPAGTVFDWFALLHSNPFMGLRNLGLLNILFCALDLPIFFALYAAQRKTERSLAALAMIVSFVGVAVFFATNRAFAMLELSRQYALAGDAPQKAMLAAAGQALLAVGQSHTPGTFLAFCLSEMAGILISLATLRSRLFSPAAAWVGMLGFACLLVFEVCTSFVPGARPVAMLLAVFGGLLSLVWDLLVARKLIELAK